MELPTYVFQLYKNVCVSLLQDIIMIPSWKVCENVHEMSVSITDSQERWRCHKSDC